MVIAADTPGITFIRNVGHGAQSDVDPSHGYIRYEDVRVPADSLLGPRGGAFVVAQTYGDRGVAVAGELRYTPDWIPISRELIEPQLYLFADHAWLGSDDPRNAPFFYEGSSVGGGLRARVKQKYTGEIEFAQGFGTPPLVNFNPWRINFRIGTAF